MKLHATWIELSSNSWIELNWIEWKINGMQIGFKKNQNLLVTVVLEKKALKTHIFNFSYQSHWEFRSSSAAALRVFIFVTLGLKICSQCGFLEMADVEDRDMELAIWKRLW